MTVPFLDLHAQYKTIQSEIEDAFHRIHAQSSYILGPETERFEEAFAHQCAVPHCIAVGSGTAALTLLLKASGIGRGDEVITVTNSFFATAEAISHTGATPIFVDCCEEDALINPSGIEQVVTPRTKAILPVHLFGQPADMEKIIAIAHAHSLLVFEDACQAHGARYQDKPVGSLADGAAFSFYPGKNLGAYGDAGCIVTKHADIAHSARMLRDHGSSKKYHHEYIGWNERMDGLQAAVLNTKLPYLQQWNTRRAAIVAQYNASLSQAIQTFTLHEDRISSHHLYVIRSHNRDALQAHLTQNGIQTGIHYPIPIHQQPAYATPAQEQAGYPVAEQLAQNILSLPLYPELTDNQIADVMGCLRSFANIR